MKGLNFIQSIMCLTILLKYKIRKYHLEFKIMCNFLQFSGNDKKLSTIDVLKLPLMPQQVHIVHDCKEKSNDN